MVNHIDHPLIATELVRLRNRECPSGEFRQRVRRVASLMVPAVTADFGRHPVECETPLEVTAGEEVSRPVVLVPVLRAGLGFVDGFLDLIPDARVVHLGLERDEETLEPTVYYWKEHAGLADAEVIVLDPMLATGGSAVQAVKKLLRVGAERIRFASLVAAPEGISVFHAAHPGVPVFTAAIDRCLDGRGYILPGLGDAGDRLFGTG